MRGSPDHMVREMHADVVVVGAGLAGVGHMYMEGAVRSGKAASRAVLSFG